MRCRVCGESFGTAPHDCRATLDQRISALESWNRGDFGFPRRMVVAEAAVDRVRSLAEFSKHAYGEHALILTPFEILRALDGEAAE